MSSWQVGDLIQNRWQVYQVLGGPGRSGMGVVYVVYDHEWETPLAAKTFQDEVFARHPAAAERFEQEALTWVALDAHENITEALFVESVAGKPYLFLEYVAGGDLDRWVGTSRLTEDLSRVLRFAIQFCDGMTHALSKGVRAHRDVKPQNCLVTSDGTLKVTDFGLAKALDNILTAETESASIWSSRDEMTRTGAAAGTCTHMAPEQFDDAKGVDVRADIYSFGVMLYQMATGRLPFIGRSWSEFRAMHQGRPAPAVGGRFSALDPLVRRCMAKDPSRRHENFAAVREELAVIYSGLTGEPAPRAAVGAELSRAQLVRKAHSLSELGRYEEALEINIRVLELDAGSASGWNNKGAVLEELGRLGEAAECYERALAINPRYGIVWANKGWVLQQAGRHREALECSERAVELDPRDADLWRLKGATLTSLGRFAGALECFDRSLELNPHTMETWHNKALCLEVLARGEEAVECYARALELNPRFGQAWCNKGTALQELGRLQESIGCFESALTLDEKDAVAWSGMAVTFNRLGLFERALDCCQRALESIAYKFEHDGGFKYKFYHNRKLGLSSSGVDIHHASGYELTGGAASAPHPYLASVWNIKGDTLASVGRPEEALESLGRALELNPGLMAAWYNKGCILNDLGRCGEAVEYFDRALELDPRNEAVWFNRGCAFGDLGRQEEAIASFDRALELDPRLEMAWLNRGRLLGELGRDEEAVECFDRALALAPQTELAWFMKGWTLAGLGRPAEAIASLDRLLELNPHDEMAWHVKGILSHDLGRDEEALACCDRALELNPNFPHAWFNKGSTLLTAFQYREALACFERALQLGLEPAAEWIMLCRHQLGE